jgi:hypothetical protein
MSFVLVYDVGASTASRSALVLALGLLAAALSWGGVLRMRGRPLDGMVLFLGIVAVLFVIVSALSAYERRLLMARTDVRTVEGPIVGLWESRTIRGGKTAFHSQGFSIGGVPFAYVRDVERNAWSNRGRCALALRDGMVLRLRYVARRSGERTLHDILRVERLPEVHEVHEVHAVGARQRRSAAMR